MSVRKMRRMLIILLSVTLVLSAFSTCVFAYSAARPPIRGTNGMVACGHPLAAHIGNRILMQGGNAFDAGAAMMLAQSLLEHQSYGFFGESTIVLYSERDKKVYEIDGGTAAPKSVDVSWFQERGIDKIPDHGLLCAGVPAVPDALITMLDEFGTMSFSEIAQEPIRLAIDGYPLWERMYDRIKSDEHLYREEWPTSAEVFLLNDRVPQLGEVFYNKDLGNLWNEFCKTEQEALAQGKTRSEALKAIRDRFYKGDMAKAIVDFQQKTSVIIPDLAFDAYPGNLTYEDFATYSAKIGEPWHTNYRGVDVYKAGPWTQGPVFLMQLNMLEQFDLQKLEYGSADYWHVVIEVSKLARADSVEWLGDDRFIAVPKQGLLSKEYAKERVKLIDMDKAIIGAKPGDPWKYNDTPKPETYPYLPGGYVPPKEYYAPSFWDNTDEKEVTVGMIHDTTGTRAVDRWGNALSVTPSGGWMRTSPVVEGFGTMLNTRVQMFYVDRTDHARSYVPGARPSTSLTATVAMKDGKPYMVMGMPGGDSQDTSTLQDFIAIVDFGYDPQHATELPHARCFDVPSLFYPHELPPRRNIGTTTISASLSEEVVEDLRQRGHIINHSKDPWSDSNATIILIDPVTGVMTAGAAPGHGRGEYAIGW